MEIRYACHPNDFKNYTTDKLREDFLAQKLITKNKVNLVYSHYDRFIIGGISISNAVVNLETEPELRADYFLERRELGIINVGSKGIIIADGTEYILENKECLYIGRGVKDIQFKSFEKEEAKFFLCSAPAHTSYPTVKFALASAEPLIMGKEENCNKRTIYKLIHEKGIQSCQLVMGMTVFEKGNTWNTLPCHRHDRRMEAYFYFDLEESARVLHFMGQPEETRHLVVANEEAVISPPWSVHFGTATNNYSFIWAMAGENKDYTDMDVVEIKDVK